MRLYKLSLTNSYDRKYKLVFVGSAGWYKTKVHVKDEWNFSIRGSGTSMRGTCDGGKPAVGAHGGACRLRVLGGERGIGKVAAGGGGTWASREQGVEGAARALEMAARYMRCIEEMATIRLLISNCICHWLHRQDVKEFPEFCSSTEMLFLLVFFRSHHCSLLLALFI
jgi:hypothetical protein